MEKRKNNCIIPLQTVILDQFGCHLLLSLKINGLKANALLDTGASRTIINVNRVAHYINEPELKPFDKLFTGVGTEQIKTSSITLPSLELKHIKLHHFEVVAIDMKPVNHSYAVYDLPRLDMVVGGDLLLMLGARIDYVSKTLIISEKH
jgi:hypothetical protein